MVQSNSFKRIADARFRVLMQQWKAFLSMVVAFLHSKTGLTSGRFNTNQVTLSSTRVKYIYH
jgi:hypothetical protein